MKRKDMILGKAAIEMQKDVYALNNYALNSFHFLIILSIVTIRTLKNNIS